MGDALLAEVRGCSTTRERLLIRWSSNPIASSGHVKLARLNARFWADGLPMWVRRGTNTRSLSENGLVRPALVRSSAITMGWRASTAS